MSCVQCGAVVARGSNFCSNCGARVAAVPPSEPRQSDEQLTWKVRRETGLPLKAYFYWKKKNGRLVRSAEFTQLELEVEVERLIAHGEDPTQFVRALEKLARSGILPSRPCCRSAKACRISPGVFMTKGP